MNDLSTSTAMGVYDYADGVTINLDAIPTEVKRGLIITTLKHKLGNECDAAFVKLREKDETLDKESAMLDLQQKMVARIMDGTIALRVGGPRGNTIERIAFELAAKQAEETLAPKGYWPKPDRKAGIKAEDASIEFAGRQMTRDDLTEMVLGKYRDKFMADAKVEHERRMATAKLAKANAVKAVASVDKSAEDLLAELGA